MGLGIPLTSHFLVSEERSPLPLLGKSLEAARVLGLLAAPISSAGAGATNKALQLTYSSSAGAPALLLRPLVVAWVKTRATTINLVVARVKNPRYC